MYFMPAPSTSYSQSVTGNYDGAHIILFRAQAFFVRTVDGPLDEMARGSGSSCALEDSLDFAIGQIIVNAVAAQQDAISGHYLRLGCMNGKRGIFFSHAMTETLGDTVALMKNLAFCIVQLVGLGCLVDTQSVLF